MSLYYCDMLYASDKGNALLFILSYRQLLFAQEASTDPWVSFVIHRLMANRNGTSKTNPRYANGNLRRKHRARLKAQGGPCGICRGRLGPIHYDEPSDAAHPLSFVVDEIRPVSKWREFGYSSPAAAAQDWNNLQAAHYICNQQKSNKICFKGASAAAQKKNVIDGDW